MVKDMGSASACEIIDAKCCGDAFGLTLDRVLEGGHRLEGERASTEIVDFMVRVKQPRRRILRMSAKPFKGVEACARFVWMVAGGDRVEDIAFYQPQVRRYTDNQLSVPGSNYGMRLFQPRPNVNQILGVRDRLLKDAESRRAA